MVTHFKYTSVYMSIWASLVVQTVKNLPTMQETQVHSLAQEDSLEEEMATNSSTLGEFHGQRNLESWSPWNHRMSDMTERLTCTCMSQIP